MNQVQKAASLLGRQNLGKKKVNISPEDMMRRIQRLAEARKKRWPKKNEHSSKEQSD
jgi:hypothetical protein